MATEIPRDILDIVDRCSSDADSVTWTDVEHIAQFFRDADTSYLADKLMQITRDADAGKYDVVLDQEDVIELTLLFEDRQIKFPYRIGQDLDQLVPILMKKHNLADGKTVGSKGYEEVYARVLSAIVQGTSRYYPPPQSPERESPQRPVYSENHLSRRPNSADISRVPTQSERSTSPLKPGSNDGVLRPITPEVDNSQSARDIQERLAEVRRANKDKSSSRQSASTSTPGSRDSSTFAPNTAVTTDPPTPKKFVLKPLKRTKRSPAKRSSVGTISSLTPEEKEASSHGSTRSSSPPRSQPPLFGSPPRKRRKQVQLRARDIVRMVSDHGYKNTIMRLTRFGITRRLLRVAEERLNAWKAFVASELLFDARQSSGGRRQVGMRTSRHVRDEDEAFDQMGRFGHPFYEDEFEDDTREDYDEEIESYFQYGTNVWARTPNQRYFRRGRVLVIDREQELVRVRFDDGRSPNDKYFSVKYQSSQLRRSSPPLEWVHIDSDDFVFVYVKEEVDDGMMANPELEMVQHLAAIARMASMEHEPVFEPSDRPRRKNRSSEQPKRTKKGFAGRGHSLMDEEDFDDDMTGHYDPFLHHNPFSFGSFQYDSHGFGQPSFGFDDDSDGDTTETKMEFHLDESAPKIAVRLRLKSGSVVNAEFNTMHTVGDVRNFLDLHHPVSGSYRLMMLGYPPKELSDDSQNVIDAQLKNSQIQQR